MYIHLILAKLLYVRTLYVLTSAEMISQLIDYLVEAMVFG